MENAVSSNTFSSAKGNRSMAIFNCAFPVSIPFPGSVSQSVYRNSTTEALYVQNANKLDRSQVKVCKLQDAKLIPRTP